MPSSVKLACIHPDQVPQFWPFVRDLIKGAFDKTGLGDFGDTEYQLFAAQQLLWIAWSDGPVIEGVATTQITREGERKVCTVTSCAGKDRERWLPLLDQIENYAKEEGCVQMRVIGRKGWERALNGYQARHVILSKELQ